MKRKVLLFGMNAQDIKQMSAFPGSAEVDLIAALSRQQVVEVLSVTTPDMVVVWLDEAMMQKYGAVLSSLVLNCNKLIVLNNSNYHRSKIALLFGETPVRVFERSDLISFWNFMLERLAKWTSEASIQLRKKQALLIDGGTSVSSDLNAILHRNNFEVVYRAFAGAEDELYEKQYDLVLAKAEMPDGTAFSAINPANRGFNKNTPFLFYSESSHHQEAGLHLFNSRDELPELEFYVKKYSAA